MAKKNNVSSTKKKPNWPLLVYLPFGVSLLIAYLSTKISPDHFWPIFIFGYLAEGLLIINTIFLVYYIWKKSPLFLYPAVLLLVGFRINSSLIQFPFRTNLGQEANLKVMSFNMQMFRNGGSDSVKTNRKKLIDLLNQEKPTIACFQEFYSRKKKITDNNDVVSDMLVDSAGYPFVYFEKIITEKRLLQGLCIASKFPIINKGYINFRTTGNFSLNACIFADIQMPQDQVVRVYNLHLESNRIRPQDYYYVDEVTESKENGSYYKLKIIVSRIKKALSKRAKQSEIVAKHIQKVDYPVIVCGDFNDPPCSYPYTTIRGNLNDSFTSRGTLRGATYIGPLPSYRIDNIFSSEKLQIIKHTVLPNKFSDHKAIEAEFYLPGPFQ